MTKTGKLAGTGIGVAFRMKDVRPERNCSIHP